MKLMWGLFTLYRAALALTITHESTQRLLESAPLVAEIEIKSVSTDYRPEPVTIADAVIVQIIRTHLSLSSQSLQLEFPGGEKEGSFLHYSGVRYPTPGERYVASLSPTERETFRVVGFDLGMKPLEGSRTFSRNHVEGCTGSNPSYIHWDRRFMPIPYFVAGESFSRAPELLAGISPSFETWRNVGGVGLDFLPMGCTSQSINENDGINSIIFVTQNWPFVPEAIAVTRNFFIGCQSSYAGQILDSDILLNAVNHRFSVGPKEEHHDIQNILTHEIGHLLGLGHETDDGDKNATMFKDAALNETKKRELKISDIAGISEAYPLEIEKSESLSGFSCQVSEKRGFACASVHREPESTNNLFFLWILVTWSVGILIRKKKPTNT